MERDRNTVEKKCFSIRGSGKMGKRRLGETVFSWRESCLWRTICQQPARRKRQRIRKSGTVYYEGSWQKERRTGRELYLTVMGRKLFPGCSSKETWWTGQEYRKDGSLYYAGEWREEIKHGQGAIYNKKEQLVYTGQFREGKRHGKGKQYREDGTLYDGLWETIRNMVRALFLPKMVNKFSQAISGMEGELISESE